MNWIMFKYDHQSSDECLFLHLSISIELHFIICLDHFILLTHIIGDIEWWLIFIYFYISICSTVIKISLICITSIRISAYIYISICSQFYISAPFESLNKIDQYFPPYSHYIRQYEPEKPDVSNMILNKKNTYENFLLEICFILCLKAQ